MGSRQLFFVPIEDLKVSRFNDHVYGNEPVDLELAKSLSTHGQLSPLLVQENNVLLSGSRRLKAMRHLKWTEALCEVIFDATPDECKRLTIEANRNRVKSQEQILAEVAALEELHNVDLAKSRAYLSTGNGDLNRQTVGPPPCLAKTVAETQNCSVRTAERRIAKAKGKKPKPKSAASNAHATLRRLARQLKGLGLDANVQVNELKQMIDRSEKMP